MFPELCHEARGGNEMMRRGLLAGCVFVLVGAQTASVAAHATFEEHSHHVDGELARYPNDPQLRIKRGDLLRLEGRYQEALVEYDKAAELDPDLASLELARGLLYADAGWYLVGLYHLDRFLEREPRHSHARKTRAKCLEKLGRLRAAADELARAAETSATLSPDLTLDRVRLLRQLRDFDEALVVLDEARGRMGPLVTIEQAAVEIQIERGAVDAALERLDSLAEASAHSERWLARKGQILEETGRDAEAMAAWSAARAALAARPAHRRATPALRALGESIDAALARLGRPETPP